MILEKGTVVISLAGRDRGEFLAAVGAADNRLLVCNGKDRPLENPKPKNPVHVKVTKTVLPPEALRGNRALKKALSLCGGKSEV